MYRPSHVPKIELFLRLEVWETKPALIGEMNLFENGHRSRTRLKIIIVCCYMNVARLSLGVTTLVALCDIATFKVLRNSNCFDASHTPLLLSPWISLRRPPYFLELDPPPQRDQWLHMDSYSSR